jgi:Tfp pilus assembly protein PilO
MKKKRSQRTTIAFVAGGLFLFAIAGFFVLVQPQRSQANELDKKIAATQAKIEARRRAIAEAQQQAPPIRVADVFRLTKAMPEQEDIAGVLLELNQIAKDAGITFESISPQRPVPLVGYQALPINVVFNGDFYSLSDFLYRLRTLVAVRRTELHASGRVYAVDSIEFTESPRKFPYLQATLTVDAFVFGTGAAPAAAPAPAPAETSTGGTGTAPTETTSTSPSTPPAAPEGATAAGAAS